MALPSSRRGVHPSQVDSDGFIKYDNAPNATKTKKGLVSIGAGIQVKDGKISVDAIPEHKPTEAGKVLTVDDDGSVIWADAGGGGSIVKTLTVDNSSTYPLVIALLSDQIEYYGWTLAYHYDLGEDFADYDYMILGFNEMSYEGGTETVDYGFTSNQPSPGDSVSGRGRVDVRNGISYKKITNIAGRYFTLQSLVWSEERPIPFTTTDIYLIKE